MPEDDIVQNPTSAEPSATSKEAAPARRSTDSGATSPHDSKPTPVKSILSVEDKEITANSDNNSNGNSDKGGDSSDDYPLKAPEGVELPKEIIENFKQQAKALKLSQKDAQKFVDMGVSALSENQKRSSAEWEKRVESETRSLEADPVLGGKNYKETRALAARAYNEIRGTLPRQTQKSLDALMVDGRLSNFRPVAEFLHAIGKRFFSEDSPVADNTGHGARPRVEGFNYDAVRSVFGGK